MTLVACRRGRPDPSRICITQALHDRFAVEAFSLSAFASELAPLPNKNAPRCRERRLLPDEDSNLCCKSMNYKGGVKQSVKQNFVVSTVFQT